jgi:AbrB family looped-hinge helix DNA binding protein
MITASARVGPRGRLVIPAEVRREAGIEEGQIVVLMPEGPGRVVVTTREAIRQEVWSGAPPADGTDAVSYIRQMRQEDNRRESERLAARESQASSSMEGTDVGADLLREFGLSGDA